MKVWTHNSACKSIGVTYHYVYLVFTDVLYRMRKQMVKEKK